MSDPSEARRRRPTDEDVGVMGPRHLAGAAAVEAAHQERAELHAAFGRGEAVDPEAARRVGRPVNVAGDGVDLATPTAEPVEPAVPTEPTDPTDPTAPKKRT